MTDWQNSWEAFIAQVAELYKQGKSDVDIARHLSGNAVAWEGVVEKLRLSERYAPGVNMRMPKTRVTLPSGIAVYGSFLAVGVKAEGSLSWQGVSVGSVVRFVGTIPETDGLMAGVWISKSELAKKKLTVTVGLTNGCVERKPRVSRPDPG